MTEPARLVWLFDIDGTLLLTGMAREVVAHTVRAHLGVDDDLADIAFAGRTDPGILDDILRKHGASLSATSRDHFWRAASARMDTLLVPGRGRVLPGVLEMLDAVAAEPGYRSALLTGNTTTMAEVKLRRYGLSARFAFGAFGEEARDRNALACVAVERARARFGVSPRRCIVVGDTEHDIACARAAGAHVVAVATGQRSRAELEGHRPDLVLDDLTQRDRCLAWAKEIAAAE